MLDSFDRFAGVGLSGSLTAAYPLGDLGSVEFQWNHKNVDTAAQPIGGGTASQCSI